MFDPHLSNCPHPCHSTTSSPTTNFCNDPRLLNYITSSPSPSSFSCVASTCTLNGGRTDPTPTACIRYTCFAATERLTCRSPLIHYSFCCQTSISVPTPNPNTQHPNTQHPTPDTQHANFRLPLSLCTSQCTQTRRQHRTSTYVSFPARRPATPQTCQPLNPSVLLLTTPLHSTPLHYTTLHYTPPHPTHSTTLKHIYGMTALHMFCYYSRTLADKVMFLRNGGGRRGRGGSFRTKKTCINSEDGPLILITPSE